MTPMLQVSPLSPERVCATWDSGTFTVNLCQLFSHGAAGVRRPGTSLDIIEGDPAAVR
jgi:hypothetical protein